MAVTQQKIMKMFRLIKEYPSSPKLGSVIKPTTYKWYHWYVVDGTKEPYFCFLLDLDSPSDYPEFWEEIK